ncbi:MAG: glycosyltransferase [Gordonia sp. (in: high G+C Gram-positive bacteria)]
MHVGIVAGPDPGHAFPAFALAERFAAQGYPATVFTGESWREIAGARGLDVRELPGLRAADADDDHDAGARLSTRAARMAVELAPLLAIQGIDLVISDVITVAGLWAAELVGVPSLELSPHPLYRPSRGLPPIGAGLAPGTGLSGRLRDTAMRAATARSIRAGERQRAAARRGIGLRAPVAEPAARLVATLPGLEVARPDWPADTHLIGPLLWEPTTDVLTPPDGPGPLVVIAPSTAVIGADGMLATTLDALREVAIDTPVRVAVSALSAVEVSAAGSEPPIAAGRGRQDELLRHADVVVCGGGHGMLAKSLLAGVPVITVPGGGDQWELANRVARRGAGRLVRPVEVATIATAVRAVLADPGYRVAAGEVAASAADVADPVQIARYVLEGGH